MQSSIPARVRRGLSGVVAAAFAASLLGGGGVVVAGGPTCIVRIGEAARKYATVQAAVDAADPGAVLHVAGACTGTVTVATRLTIRGVPSEKSWLLAPEGARAIDVLATGKLTLAGLRIVGAGQVTGAPGGVVRVAGALTVAASTITGGDAQLGGGGIAVLADASLVLGRGARVTANRADGNGGGIRSEGSVTMRANARVDANEAPGHGGGGIQAAAGSLAIFGSARVDHNRATYGGGIATLPGAVTTIGGRASIDHNTVTLQSGGMESGGELLIKGRASVAFNVAPGSGSAGGIGSWAPAGARIIGRASIHHNSADSAGGIGPWGGTFFVGGRATIRDNSARIGGGAWVDGGDLVLADGARIVGNRATESGGGIYVESGSIDGACGTGRVRGNTAPADPQIAPACPVS